MSHLVDPADLIRPTLNDISLTPPNFTTAGTTLHYALDDSSVVDAEIWHSSHGDRGKYAGWEQWRGHIGFNQARLWIHVWTLHKCLAAVAREIHRPPMRRGPRSLATHCGFPARRDPLIRF